MPGHGKRLPLLLLLALTLAGVVLLLLPRWPAALVTVVTVPTGCSLTASDGVGWISPATVPVPSEGLELRVEHRDWLPADTVLDPVMGDTVRIRLDPCFSVRVSSEPPGALVSMDGVQAGVTPCTISVDRPGGHFLSIESGQGTLLTDSVCIISGGVHLFHYRLPVAEASADGMPEMILVPRGSYRTGTGSSMISRDFMMARYEVTNDQFAAFLDDVDPGAASDSLYPEGRTLLLDSIAPCNWFQPVRGYPGEGYSVADGYGDHPVTGLSPQGMQMYCDWLTAGGTGPVFRLPSRTEWTVCASAGGSWPWPWGSWEPSGGLLNMSDSAESLMCRCPGLADGFAFTAPVGSYPPNAWGFYDMAGNVWELCQGGTAAGGSWLSDTSDCRIDASVTLDPQLGYAYVGFRPAADPDPREEGM